MPAQSRGHGTQRDVGSTTVKNVPPVRSAAPVSPSAPWSQISSNTIPDEPEVLPPWPLVLLRKWMNPLAAVSLGVCALTLVVAATGRLSWLVAPLGAVAGVIGLIACRRAFKAGKALVMPVTAAALGLFAFFVAVVYPPALGPGYEAARDHAPSASEIRIIPHASHLSDPDVQSGEWVDGSKASLQQGRVRVAIADVFTQPGAEKELCIRIRMQRTKTGEEIAAGAFASPLTWDERIRATLRDAAGTSYIQKPGVPGRARGAGPSSASTVTVDVSHELLVFDLPPSPTDGLKLELPATAWGGTGSLKFSIPGVMVRTAPTPGRRK